MHVIHSIIIILTMFVGLIPTSYSNENLAGQNVALQGADFYRFHVGNVTITSLSDGTVPQDLHKLLRGITGEGIDTRLDYGFLVNPVEASINAFLVKMPDRLVLVDTGAGELFGPGNGGKLIESLAAAGYSKDQIDDILITHVHTDHSGGLVKNGKIVFENATVHVSKPDADFFLNIDNAASSGYEEKYFEEADSSLTPYKLAGKLSIFSDGDEVVPGVVASIHPGHTPGSSFFTLTSAEETVTFIGDIIHVAAIQFPDPQVTIIYDVDRSKAKDTRVQAFAKFAGNRELVAAPHLPFPGIGHIKRSSPGYSWVPVEYRNRKAK